MKSFRTAGADGGPGGGDPRPLQKICMKGAGIPPTPASGPLLPREDLFAGLSGLLVADLPAAAYHVLVARQLLHAHGTARVKFVRADADFRAHAEFAPVGELRRRILQNDGAVDPGQKPLRCGGVVGDDALGVLRAVAADVFGGRVPALP